MTRTSLDDALWASLMLTMQQVPHARKRDEAALRRFVEAALWLCRTGAPWRDLPDDLGHRPRVHHRFRRGSVRGWMFSRHIQQANEGCDFDVLRTGFGQSVPEPAIC